MLLFIRLSIFYSILTRTQRSRQYTVKSLKNIKRCAVTISGLYVLGLPLFHFIAKKMEPPIGLVGLIIIFASFVSAVFTAILQRLLQEAINIKSENDLTV